MRNSILRLSLLTSLAGAASCSSPSTTGPNGVGGPPCNAGLVPGDLVITEVLANPSGDDGGKEWFEIYSTLDKPVTLTGVQVIASKADGSSPKTHVLSGLTVEPGKYMVLGDVLEAARPTWTHYSYGNDLGSLPSAGALTIRCGDRQIDKVIWDAATDARTRGFDGTGAPDAIANDDVLKWCDAATEFNSDFKGTPGTRNDECGCTDKSTGMPLVAPTAGQLVISEVMASPAGDDTKQEWIELTATATVNLAGLALAKDMDPAKSVSDLPKGGCIPLKAGEHVVLIKSLDKTLNGGVEAAPGAPVLTLPSGISVGSSSPMFELSVHSGTTLVDKMTMHTANAKTGLSWALDPMSIDATKNDDDTSWCLGKRSYGDGTAGKGTPGKDNTGCHTCFEGATERAKVTPRPGDLVVNEVMPSPTGTDANQEWFELKVNADVDLNGVSLSADPMAPSAQLLPDEECLRVTTGSFVVFARSVVEADNGGLKGLAPWQKITFSKALAADGALTVHLGLVQIDAATWMGAVTGKSVSLDPVQQPAVWCNLADPMYKFNGVDFGTPGAANPPCL